jgi:hypothetical protein
MSTFCQFLMPDFFLGKRVRVEEKEHLGNMVT